MTAAYDLTNAASEVDKETQPHVFSRIFTVPAGAPWEQGRAAQLEARHGSPLPISELAWRLRRLGSWGPGRPGRFAVFYVRARELTGAFETTVELDGEPLRVSFGSPGDRLRRIRLPALVGLGAALAGLVVAISFFAALDARARADEELSQLERKADSEARDAKRLRKWIAQDRELSAAIGKGAPLDVVLADFAWATSAKSADARISAIHWDRGLLAVESRGEAPPLAPLGRQLERSARPLRPGVWLWGAKPVGIGGSNHENTR